MPTALKLALRVVRAWQALCPETLPQGVIDYVHLSVLKNRCISQEEHK